VSYVRKLELFKRLQEDIKTMVEDGHLQATKDKENNIQCASERVKWAIQVVSEDKRYVDHMIEDLTASLNAVSTFKQHIVDETSSDYTLIQLFHLRSIEQNELAMITDDQNRALYLFTGITIVFLPLSFFTSYFGMNIADIRNTDMEQGRFWTICGPVTVGLILLVWCGIRIGKGLQQRTKLFREMSKQRQVT
jgi:Mg2+ and Co2+ transporter CorA